MHQQRIDVIMSVESEHIMDRIHVLLERHGDVERNNVNHYHHI